MSAAWQAAGSDLGTLCGYVLDTILPRGGEYHDCMCDVSVLERSPGVEKRTHGSIWAYAAIAVASRRRGLTSGARPVSQSVTSQSFRGTSRPADRPAHSTHSNTPSAGASTPARSQARSPLAARPTIDGGEWNVRVVRMSETVLGARSTVVSRFTDQRRPLPRDAQSHVKESISD